MTAISQHTDDSKQRAARYELKEMRKRDSENTALGIAGAAAGATAMVVSPMLPLIDGIRGLQETNGNPLACVLCFIIGGAKAPFMATGGALSVVAGILGTLYNVAALNVQHVREKAILQNLSPEQQTAIRQQIEDWQHQQPTTWARIQEQYINYAPEEVLWLLNYCRVNA